MSRTLVETPTSRCRAGLAHVDITPPVGIYHRFWGAAKHDRATGVHRPLRATVLLLGEGVEQSAVVAIDHCLFRPDDMSALREQVQHRTGLPADRLAFTFSHTHSGGHVVRARGNLPGGDLIGPYLDGLPEQIENAFAAARDAAREVTISYAHTRCAMGNQRDFYDAANETHVCGFNPEEDEALPVTVARLTDDDGALVGTIVGYPCHPTTLAWDNTLISPDYVGALRDTIESSLPAPCLFLQAPCGDIGPRYGFVGDTAVADANGRQLAYAALSALESITPPGTDFAYEGPVISGATIGFWSPCAQNDARREATTVFQRRRVTVALPYLADLPTIEQTEAELAGHLEREATLLEQNDAAAARDERALAERCRRTLERIQPLEPGDVYPYAADIWRLGDAWWVFVEGEPYYDLQKSLQQRFPQRTTVVTTLSDGARCGYLPSREAYDKKGLYQEILMKTALSVAATGLLLAICCTVSVADDWPQFRGPNSSGISTSSASLPVKFSDKKNVQWSHKVGDGIGCPVVAAGRAFVSGMLDDETVALFAFDVKTGKQLWRRTWKTGELPEIHKTNSHASTTPAADDKRVYFYFSTLGMRALDAQTGADAWTQKLPTPFFVFKWGAGMSPVLYKNMVLFCQDDDMNPSMYAFDRETGKILWRDDRSDQAVNYSHPVICSTSKGDEIVVAGTGMLVGYDPKTGKRLWHAKTLLRNIKTTPVVVDDVIYISLQSGGIANQWLATADRSKTGNNDGKLTKAEMQAFVGKQKIPEAFYKKTFDRGDTNKDGFLEGEELDKAFLHPDNFAGAKHDAKESGDEFILAVKGGGRGDVTKSHLLWKHETKHTDHIVSPFVHDGRMLLIKGGGIATQFETKSGKPIRGPKRIGNTCQYFASPVYADGKIYVAGDNGYIVVLKNDAKYDVLSKNNMGEPILGTPAIADGRLFVRTRTKLFCIGAE
eukprot:g32959.t1